MSVSLTVAEIETSAIECEKTVAKIMKNFYQEFLMSASLTVAEIKTSAIEGEKIVAKIMCQQKEIEESAKKILSKIPAIIGNDSNPEIELIHMLKTMAGSQEVIDKFEKNFKTLQAYYKKLIERLNWVKERYDSMYNRINPLKDLFQLVTSKPNITEIEELEKKHNNLASQVYCGRVEILIIQAELTLKANTEIREAFSGIDSLVEETNELYEQLLNSLAAVCLMPDENSNLDNSATAYTILFLWSSLFVLVVIMPMFSFFERETNTDTRLAESRDSSLLPAQLPVAITAVCAMSAVTAVYFWNKNRIHQHQEQPELESATTYRPGASNS